MARLVVSAAGKSATLDTEKINARIEDGMDIATDKIQSVFHSVGDFISTRVKSQPSPFTIDETLDFNISSKDDNHVAFLKQHIQHWKREAQGWRQAFHDCDQANGPDEPSTPYGLPLK